MKLVWRLKAEQELAGQIRYLANENPRAALRMAARVEQRLARLLHFPLGGRPSRLDGVRELVISGTPFVAIYRVDGDGITILRFFHAQQRRPD